MNRNDKTAPDESLTAPGDTSSRLLKFITDEAPASGSALEIAEGVFWLRFDLPMKGLDHINLWALKDGDGLLLIQALVTVPVKLSGKRILQN